LRVAGTICFALALIILLATLSLTYRDWQDTNRDRGHVRQTRRIQSQNAAIVSLMKDAETGQREYLLTGDAGKLAPLRTAAATASRLLDELQKTAAEMSSQQARVESMRSAVAQELADLNATVELRKQQGLEAALESVRTRRSATASAQIRETGEQIGQAVLAQRSSMALVSEARRRRVRTLTVVGSGVLFRPAAGRGIRHRSRQRTQQAERAPHGRDSRSAPYYPDQHRRRCDRHRRCRNDYLPQPGASGSPVGRKPTR